MSARFQFTSVRIPVRFALMSATALLIAGCSSDASRLADLGVDRTATGSTRPVPPDSVGGSYPVAQQTVPRSSAIQSSPLPAPSIPSRPNFTAPATPSPRAAAAPVAQQVATTATAGRSSGPWTAAGGTAIVAGQGDTASALSNRYGVPQDALLKVNGLSSASQIQPGTRLTIPVYNLSAASSSSAAPARPVATAPVAPARQPVAAKPEPAKPVRMTETAKPVAAAKPVPATKPAPATKPVANVAPAKPEPVKAKVAEVKKPEPARKPEKVAEKPADKPVQTAKVEPARPVKVDATPTASVPAADAKPAADEKPEFRWPARGRVIQGFKSGGNDGINIAVPEGTAVKAAEGGVVAYAGSELKGYGNLVLIRHPNGYVSAYAHNGELGVKRGETVKRGQTIAKSGQSGNVSSPQLHFELRKGSTPVDPSNYLAGL